MTDLRKTKLLEIQPADHLSDQPLTAAPERSGSVVSDAKPDSVIGIQSVTLTFQVLEEMAAAGGPIGVSELARRLGEAKARIHRHLITLRDLGILVQDRRSERYRLGWKLFELGHAAGSQFEIQAVALPFLKALRDTTGLSAGFTVPLGDEAVVTEVVDSESLIAVSIRKGLHMSLFSSNVGRIILAFSTEETQRRLLARAPKQLSTDNTNIACFKDRLRLVRSRLYDVSYNEAQTGICGISAPVLDDEERVIAVVGVVGTQPQIEDPPTAQMIRAVHACAAGISATIGSNVYGRLGLTNAENSRAAG